jgi:hypothetical protein
MAPACRGAASRGIKTVHSVRNRILLGLTVAALYLLHQDVWFWRTARPLVFGFLPIGLAYHAVYCVAAALLMWLLTSLAWPTHLEGSHRGAAGPPGGAR